MHEGERLQDEMTPQTDPHNVRGLEFAKETNGAVADQRVRKSSEGVPHSSTGSGAKLGGCAHAHPLAE
jgi:hypothetical protein